MLLMALIGNALDTPWTQENVGLEIFAFEVGLQRWLLRVQAYTWLLTTDRYPPFGLR